MKKILSVLLVCALLITFGMFALGSSSDDDTVSQGEGSVSQDNNDDSQQTENTTNNNSLGDYIVEIKSCRLAKDFEKKDVVIVTYSFTNQNDETPASFMVALEDNVYQAGVGLNECYFVDEAYNYNSDNSTKEIKKGASIDVEVAYVLNDTTTPVDVEISELFSFDNKTITKQFALN